MKQYIVMIAMIALGVFIYGLIAGSSDGSLAHHAGKALLDAARGSFAAG
ncbi:MAG: hypothetical protein LBG82_07540 [Clostridiales Family XIII bacterium]|jgi:hypothetical protein|nr:hypothetical protein [Clostridiales Family XIII bacterium]